MPSKVPGATYWVYILECKNGAFYTGYTNDVKRRYRDHCAGKGAKYTRSFKPVRIAQIFPFESQSAAMQAELKIKKLPLQNKRKLIVNPKLYMSLCN